MHLLWVYSYRGRTLYLYKLWEIVMINELREKIGVEFDEEFNIKGFGDIKFILTPEGLLRYERGGYYKDMFHLGMLVVFPEYVIKIPFKPTIGTRYYAPNWDSDNIWVEPWESSGELWDDILYKNQLTYRTEEEAKRNLLNDYKKVTGKEWEKQS